jgi:excinuclease ABC subunit C
VQEEGKGKALPDLILIDGGAGQLASAERALADLGVQGLLLVGVSKGEGRKPGLETLHFSKGPPLRLPPDSIALHFVQQVRDEAHRFAITGHRQRRDKKRRTSVLESIPGIGVKRRRALLKHFGGLQAIEVANVEQLLEVSGMTPALAEEVYLHFHGNIP